MSKLVAEEYLSSLTDLTVNSKPLINMLTMLADENVDHAPAIVQVIENHLEKVFMEVLEISEYGFIKQNTLLLTLQTDSELFLQRKQHCLRSLAEKWGSSKYPEIVPPDVKLPILYLIDSIIKNVSKVYVPLFTQNIVNVFVSVFEKVDERTRLNMYKLRQTWTDVFPARKLYVLDLRVKDIDHAWPVTAPTPTSIHFNPKFLGNKTNVTEASGTNAPTQVTPPAISPATAQSSELTEAVLREQLPEKQKILIELQQKKLELQLMQTKALMEGQENRLNDAGEQSLITNLVRPPMNEEAAKLFSRRAVVKPKAVVTPPANTTPTKSVTNNSVRPPHNEKAGKLFSRRGAGKSKASGVQTNTSAKLDSSSNTVQTKTKIAPASSQLIEAAKSRDPRIARQQQQQLKNSASKSEQKRKNVTANSKACESSKSRESKAVKQKQQNKVPEVTQKEQEIYNRQLAMLKPPIAEQVAPVVPAQKDLENLVNVSGKDVDLRLLNVRSESPSKKRLSPEVPVDEPPKKKNKSEIFDEISSLRHLKQEKPFFPINVLSYVNTIIAQAADQVRNGNMSLIEYNEVLKQVIHVNEKQKLREAQNKSRQEVRRNHHRNRRSPNRFGPHNRNSPTFRHDEDRRERLPYNDIDERLQIPWANRLPNDSAPGFNRLEEPCGSHRTPFDISEYNERPKSGNVWEEGNSKRRTDDFDQPENRLRDVMCNDRTHDCVDVPPADPQTLELIAKDPMKSINIDGTARDIRFYGDTAVVMLSYDDPKEISFEDGIRRVAIGDISIVCALNGPYIMFMLNGTPHRIRLGAPTRELYIDGEFYEAHFGGSPVQIQIDGLPYLVQLEGPPPQVKIGKRRTDLICGRVNMIVDATEMLPLHLDAKPQRFDLKSRPYIFRFINCLKTLLVNEVPLDIQFNGGCRQICGYGNLHFLRLSMLPNGVEPGRVQIVNMENLIPSVTNISESTVSVGSHSPSLNNQQSNFTDVNPVIQSFDATQQLPASCSTGEGPLDILTSLMSGATTPVQSAGFNYQVESTEQQEFTQPSTTRSDTETTMLQPQNTSVPILGSGLNINDLFQRLVATGIVPTLSNTVENNPKPQNESPVKPIDFSDPNSLRERQPPIINILYSGIQCSSCGVRFSPEETVKYSRHLDWHFRQNRREKDAMRKGQSRKWYYDVSDWIQFEEIEDLEERAQSWFETEATTNGEENNEQEEIKSVPAPPGHDFTLCELCRDEFDTYYNEEKEEWHLKPCILVENKYYHPVCYEDLINMPEDSLVMDKTTDMSIFKEETIEKSIKMEEAKEEVKSEEGEKEESVADVCKFERESDVSMSVKNDSDQGLELELEDMITRDPKENPDQVIKTLLNELINCIVFKNEMDLEEENEEDTEIEVLESVSVEQKKEIINVDLIEKLDDEDDEIVYHRKTPSPIILIPTSKIKQEPVDEMESPVAVVDQTITNVVSSIDGNVEKIDAPQVAPSAPSKIKITFNKPLINELPSEKPVVKELPPSPTEESDPDPLPPRPKKPRIAEREMTVYLPCVRGTEMSGLCCIM